MQAFIHYLKYPFFFLSILVISNCAPKVGGQVQTTTPPPPAAEPATDFRSTPPEPGAARKIEIGTYETFTLDNGLRVIVVENHKIPQIGYQVFVDRDPVQEGAVAGMTAIAGALLSKGTTTRTKAQIDESIDFVGGSLNTHSQGGYASCLTRHSETVLTIFSDVILNPSFPESEFEKLKKQTISDLQTQKDDPNAISANVSDALVYGKDHPYGEITTEVSVNTITLADCKAYYEKYFKPNITYLVVVGDITPAQARSQAEKYFGGWKRGEVPTASYPTPQAPPKTQVEFVDKAGAVQSVINITYPVDFKPGSPEAIAARVMNTILGSGFSGRLFKNLREDKAYTYGAYSDLSSDELVGIFSANAAVRNEVTDSALTQFMYELNGMILNEVTDTELELTKNYIAGQFARSLESPQTVAGFALNIFRYNLPKDYYNTYLEQLERVSKADVVAMAKKYIRPENAHIIVVGNQDAVSEKLTVFDKNDGVIDFYDIYGNKKAAPAATNINVSGADVINAYVKAIGGESKLRAVNSMSMDAVMPVQGMGEMNVVVHQAAPGMMHMSMGMTGMTMMKQVFDGTKGYVEQMGNKQPIEGELLEQVKHDAKIFPELDYVGDGFTIEVKGMEEINGEQAYKVLISNTKGSTTEFYSVDRGLKLKSIESQGEGDQMQMVITDFSDYREVDGVMVPFAMKITGMAPFPLEMKVTGVKLNAPIDPALFSVE